MAKSRDLYKVSGETYRINPDNHCDIPRMQPKSHTSCNNMFHTLKSPDESLSGQLYLSQNINSYDSTTHLETVSYSQSLFNDLSSRNMTPNHSNQMGLPDSPMNNDWCQFTPTSTIKKDTPKIMNIRTNQNDTHSNLIDLYSPPNSPSIKPESSLFTSDKQSLTFHPSSSVSDIESLTEEFSLLASKEEIVIGSVVEVLIKNQWLVGTVRWCGRLLNQSKPHQISAGIELGQEIEEGTDGSCSGHQYFVCHQGKGIFVPVKYCKKYSLPRSSISCLSISSPSSDLYEPSIEMEYGGPDCPPVTGQVAPIGQSGDVSKLAGKFRGIQGHHNSCYLDATLFSMFTFTRKNMLTNSYYYSFFLIV